MVSFLIFRKKHQKADLSVSFLLAPDDWRCNPKFAFYHSFLPRRKAPSLGEIRFLFVLLASKALNYDANLFDWLYQSW